MCGVVARLRWTSLHEADMADPVAAMISALAHRGPDGQGSWSTPCSWGGASLGHRRLAILDTSGRGAQPMRSSDGAAVVVHNGEIYNHLDLRRSLRGPEGGWRGSGDTETLLQGFVERGIRIVEDLRGMFAFCLWDARDEVLWCARDRFGIKPLYFAEAPGGVSVASEVRALLASGEVARDLDPTGLAGYMRFGSVPEPHTLLRGVRSLPPGHVMALRGGVCGPPTSYWAGPCEPVHDGGDRSVRSEVERAVREHLLSDVPVACFLSGGIDSAVVAALAARSSTAKLQTFTVCFPGTPLDEREPAAAVARRHGTDHHEVTLGARDVLDGIEEAAAAQDLPSIDGFNTFLLAKAVKQAGFKVVLSGLGGDELFGGYPTFRRLALLERWAAPLRGIPAWARAGLVGGGSRGRRFAEATAPGATSLERYQALRALWSRDELRRMGFAAPSYDAFWPCPQRGPEGTSALELQGYMRSTLLRDADAMSMAHSLELRVPFLDHLLVETCFARGAASGSRPKGALIEACSDLLPEGHADRPKRGFALPMAEWMRGPLRAFVQHGLRALRETEPFEAVDSWHLPERFEAGRLSWSRLWQSAVLGHWLERNLRVEAGPVPAASAAR